MSPVKQKNILSAKSKIIASCKAAPQCLKTSEKTISCSESAQCRPIENISFLGISIRKIILTKNHTGGIDTNSYEFGQEGSVLLNKFTQGKKDIETMFRGSQGGDAMAP
ncbi:hypothetical protein ACFLU6_06710 [Acidobacteriota bacterium]